MIPIFSSIVEALNVVFLGAIEMEWVYVVDLTTGHATLIADIPNTPELGNIVVIDDKLAYTTGASNNLVYAIHLQEQTYSIITPTPVPGTLANNGGIFGIDILTQPTNP